MNTNFDIDAAMRDLLLLAAAEELRATPAADPQVTPAYQKKFAQMQADPFGYAKRLNRPFKRRLQRAAIAAVLLLAVIFGTIMAIPQTRTIAINMLTKFYSEYVAVIFYSKSAGLTTLPAITCEYIPAGYELCPEEKPFDEQLWLEYVNAEGNYIYIGVYIAQDNQKFYVDIEHHELSEVKLADNTAAQLFTATDPADPNSANILIWRSADNRLLFNMNAKLPPEELLNIANNIKIGE